MAFGIIEYDNDGNPICEICKKSFKRVICHVRQAHDLSEREYKMTYGFDLGKGICSKESSELSRTKALRNYDKCIKRNLIIKGANARFTTGSKGRTKDQVSEQTRKSLKNRLKEPYMIKAMKASGERVGKSGLGNLARWRTKNKLK